MKMKMSNGKDILDVNATRTDSAGNGYYRASDGYYYYSNVQNGTLVETEETKRLKAQKAAQNAGSGSSSYSYSSSSEPSIFDELITAVGFKIGTHVGNALINVLSVVVPFVVKICIALGLFPNMIYSYTREFITHSDHIGCKLLSIVGILAVFALMGYGIYRKVKGQKSISKAVFIGEFVAMIGIYYLNYSALSSEPDILLAVLMAVGFAISVKVFSGLLEAIIYSVYRIINKRK